MPTIGYLTLNSEGTPTEQGFRDQLRELGYAEGSSIVIERRYARLAQLAALASELVQKRVDLIVTVSTPAARAAMEATATIPIIFLSGAPVSAGLAMSIAHPGRNATGVSILSTELYPKRIEYLHLVAPRARRIAYLMNPANPIATPQLEAVQKAAQKLGLQLLRFDVRDPDELDAVLAAITRSKANAVLIGGDAYIYSNMAKVVQALRKAKLPAISPSADSSSEGVLMSYGADTRDVGRKMAVYADKILKGAKPADLPIEEIFHIQARHRPANRARTWHQGPSGSAIPG
jgi:putative ABC transport system substrate-binding protein